MRAPRLAVVFGATGILLGTLLGAGPAAAAGTESLTVNPDSGRPAAPFAADYRFFPPTLVCPSVQFTWDGRAPKSYKVTPQRRARLSDPCVARLVAVPPSDDREPGPHTVGAGTLTATYTISPGPTSTARPSPTRTGTRPPTAGATDDIVAGGVDTSQASVAPLDSGAASVADLASGGSGGGGGLISWILIFGGLLVLGGITIFGLLVYWTRRGGPGDLEPDATEPDAMEPAAMEPDTKVFGE